MFEMVEENGRALPYVAGFQYEGSVVCAVVLSSAYP